jgi:glycosyltransferase involved in cell wall biosynthesis
MAGKKRTKVLMTADTVGGVWTYAIELIQSLEPHGVEVHLATMGGPLHEHQQKDIDQLQNVALYPSSFKLEWMESPGEDLEKAARWLLLLNEAVQPDLIHLNNLAFAGLDWGRPVIQVVHSCVLSWWKAVKQEEAPSSWDSYRQLVQQSLRAADLVVAPTQAMLEEARRIYGPFRQQKVIYNGRDPSRFRYGQKEPFIFSMGRIWDEAKNLSLLAEVAPMLSWPVYLSGDAVHPATGQPVRLPNVHFLGRLSPGEVRDWLSRAAVFVLPVRYEPFGLAVLEAAMSGCALVVGDTGSLREVWGDAAHYVSPDSPDQLRTAVEKLTANETERTNMSCRALKQSLSYTASLQANQYLRTYQELMDRTTAEVDGKKTLVKNNI